MHRKARTAVKSLRVKLDIKSISSVTRSGWDFDKETVKVSDRFKNLYYNIEEKKNAKNYLLFSVIYLLFFEDASCFSCTRLFPPRFSILNRPLFIQMGIGN